MSRARAPLPASARTKSSSLNSPAYTLSPCITVARARSRLQRCPASTTGIGLPHGFVHVVPAAHVCVLPPLHVTVHAAEPPHCTVQPDEPAQLAVQPPCGQSIMHVLWPVQSTLDPEPTVTWHVLPPPHVSVLFVPVVTVQLLVPSHVVLQFDAHVLWHVDCPSHVVVQPVPHEALQSFFELQW